MEWKGKTVKFPRNRTFTNLYGDTLDCKHYDSSEYKVLVYVDSVGCIGCKLDLWNWKMFKKELDSVTTEEVPILMYISTREIKKIVTIQRLSRKLLFWELK